MLPKIGPIDGHGRLACRSEFPVRQDHKISGTSIWQPWGLRASRDQPETIIPIYEFECEACGQRFEELMAAGSAAPACPDCGASATRRVFTSVSPPGRQPRGAVVRSDESRRRERESARQDRITESRKRRATGEKP